MHNGTRIILGAEVDKCCYWKVRWSIKLKRKRSYKELEKKMILRE